MGRANQHRQWPADMERRRIADLLEFHRKNPDYVFTPEQLPGVSGIRNQAGGGDRRLRPSPLRSKRKRGNPGYNNENRWCLETTLELLKEMKAYVQANKVSVLGENYAKWKAIAINLSNPRGLELRKLARSSMVRFDNLRRHFRTSLRERIHPQVQDSMIEYFHVCDQNKLTSGATLASGRVVSTMDMALGLKVASPDPPSSPAMKMICSKQTSVGSGELPLEADQSSTGFELALVPVSPRWTADNADTSTRVLSLPAVERGSSDPEDVGRRYAADSWAAPNRLRSRRLPKADTSPAARRGVRRSFPIK